MSGAEDQRLAYAKMLARVWSDDAYKARLYDDPSATLKEAGIDIPAGVEVKVLENTPELRHVVLPSPPAEGELMEDDLERVAGGSYIFTCPDL
jgi:hypothetical protein